MPTSKEGGLSLKIGRDHLVAVLDAGAATVDLLPPKTKVVGASIIADGKGFSIGEMADIEIELFLERVPQPEMPAPKAKPGPKPGAKARKQRQALGAGAAPAAEKKEKQE